MEEETAGGVPWRVFAVAALVLSSFALSVAGATAAGGGPAPPLRIDGRELASGPGERPTAVYIVSTEPADGEVDVPLSTPIIVRFSEPVSPTTITWSMIPAFTMTPYWDTNYTLLTLAHSTPFALCTTYTVAVLGVDQGPVPNPWSFSTFCPNPYIVSTLPRSRATGVSLTAPIIVTFSHAMDTSNVTWTLSPALGLTASWNTPTDTVLTLTHAYPFSMCTAYTIAIRGTDSAGLPLVAGPAPNPFSFSTWCTVELLSPIGGEDWTGGSTHAIVWNQSSPSGADMAWTLDWLDDGMWVRIANGTAGNGIQTYDWTVPRVDRTNAQVRVCAGPPPGYQDCSTSGPFTIDSTAPAVVSHDPPDGARNVPSSVDLVVTFSEGMNQSNVEAAFYLVPSVAGLPPAVWPDPTTLILRLENLASGVTYTWGFSCSGTDASDPGNPLVNCQETHSFSTGPSRTSVSLLSPLGRESWTGGSTHPVRFLVDNRGPATDTFAVAATYRYSGGASGGSIGSVNLSVPAGSSLEGQFSWGVPLVDATDVTVNVTAMNQTGAPFWDESGLFEIDSTPPIVVSVEPVVVFPSDPIVVTFSEGMARASAQTAFSISPAVASLSFRWSPSDTILTVDHAPLMCGVLYSLIIATGAHDDSDPGNPLSSPFARSLMAACPPTVSLLAPIGGEDWTGGSVHAIEWVTSDPDDSSLILNLSFSLDGGADDFSNLIAGPLVLGVGAGSFSWTLPAVDSDRVLVRIAVVDPAGSTASDISGPLTIDSTPPALLVSFPADGASGHKTTRDLWFVWTERVDRASFASAFDLSPNPGGLRLEWSVSNLGGDVLLVTHDPMRSRTTYTVTFAASAKDDSDPGNALAAPIAVRFTTQPPPPVNPPVALAVGHHQVPVGEPATFDGTGSTGDIRDYVWRIADNQGGFVAVLVGATATYTFSHNGRYSVTLFVTDVNGYMDDDTIEIAVTSNPHSDGLIAAGAAGAALAMAALVGGTEAGKLGAFQLLLFPLYARRKRDELLDQETRGMIRGYILVHPGDSYSDIKKNLALSNGTLSYHLTVLEREGIVRSQTRGSRKLFFPREVRLPNDGGGMHEVQIRMLRAVEQIPGLAVTDLAGALGITSQLALYHLRDLASKGRIRFERRGLRLRCYAEGADAAPDPSAPMD